MLDVYRKMKEKQSMMLCSLKTAVEYIGNIRIAASALDRNTRQKTSAYGDGWPSPTGDMTSVSYK